MEKQISVFEEIINYFKLIDEKVTNRDTGVMVKTVSECNGDNNRHAVLARCIINVFEERDRE